MIHKLLKKLLLDAASDPRALEVRQDDQVAYEALEEAGRYEPAGSRPQGASWTPQEPVLPLRVLLSSRSQPVD